MKRMATTAGALILFSSAIAGVEAIAETVATLDEGYGTAVAEADEDWETPIFYIHDAECDVASDCSLATLSCGDPLGRGLVITFNGIETAPMTAWMQKGMKIAGEGLVADSAPLPGEIMLSDSDGNWSVAFYAPYSSDPGLSIVGDRLLLSTPPRTIILPLIGENRVKLERFIQLCARE